MNEYKMHSQNQLIIEIVVSQQVKFIKGTAEVSG